MGAAESKAKIQELVKNSEFRPELLKQAAIALGLLGDNNIVPDLTEMLRNASSLSAQAAIASALGFIGDQRSIDPLVKMLKDESLTDGARGFAAVALGIVADKESLPWNSKVAVDVNYRASTQTLNTTDGKGILNIL
jgi:HEAT repeat protein